MLLIPLFFAASIGPIQKYMKWETYRYFCCWKEEMHTTRPRLQVPDPG
jgi:hypothetical protein